MLNNEYLVAKIGVDTAENEPLKVGRPPPIRTLKIFHTVHTAILDDFRRQEGNAAFPSCRYHDMK